MNLFNKIMDLFLFRIGVEEYDDGKVVPIITTGSIVWGILLRTAVIIVLSFLLMSIVENRKFWWITLLLLWLLAAYPGWKQFQFYKRHLEEVAESTLCGRCVHFDETSQLCKLYDEHISENYIPCGGVDWEPKQFDRDEN